MRNRQIPLFLAILVPGIVHAQPAPKPLVFEVASVKPSEPDARGPSELQRSSLSIEIGESLKATNTTLRTLISFAYDIRDVQLAEAPAWIGSDRYEITTKTAAEDIPALPGGPRAPTRAEIEASDNRVRERARSLLAERFGLVVHRETRDETVYLLTVAKTGSRLQKIDTAPKHETTGGRGHLEGHAATIAMMIGVLSNATGRPVVDRTGLNDTYDWILRWTPDAPGVDAAQLPEGAPPTIFTAIQEQLGLRLESGKAPIEMLVIDKVNRPTAN